MAVVPVTAHHTPGAGQQGDGVALAHPLPADLIELIADRFRVLSEPMRITLLDRLRDGEASVGALSAAVGTSDLSKHLGVL